MKLKDYIKKRGEDNLAKDLGVSVDTVKSWRYGNRQPSVNQAKKIIKMTNYALGWENIYGPIDECQ
jgi:DNA-binding XRE family transcriptional regulator|tara:strand:- start:173 stop:370 length:198 start_codon:yes stop_codon:yes gene_type:complete